MKPATPVMKTFFMKMESGGGERSGARLQGESDAEVAEDEGDFEGEEAARLDGEIRIKFGEDLVRTVNVFAADELLVGNVEMFFPKAIGGDHAGEGVGRAALRGNDDEELAALFVEETVGFADGGGKIGQVLEDVDSDEAIKKTVGERERFLAVADDGLDTRENPADVGRHVLTEFVGVVIFLLLGGEFLVVEVFAEAGADFEGGFETGVREFNREGMVEILDHPVAVGELLVPEFHELVAALLLLGSENGEEFGPLGGLHMRRGKGGKRGAERRK